MKVVSDRVQNGVVIVKLAGPLTEVGDELLPRLRELVGMGQTDVLLDLSDCAYGDSSGFSRIAACYLELHHHHGTLKLLRPQKRIQDQLVLMKLVSVIETFEDENEALESFTGDG